MGYITQYEYYENNGDIHNDLNWGTYQYVSLDEIVTNFLLFYQGNHEIINNVPRSKILFHAKRAIQELNYDAMKETKILEIALDDALRYPLPSDYVNWMRISMHKNGSLFPLGENKQTNTALAYLQDHEYNILFDIDGNALSPEFSELDLDRILAQNKSIYLNAGSPRDGQSGYNCDGNWYFGYDINGGRFGLNTDTANANPTFGVDNRNGVINFSSNMAGELIVLEYVSDGLENGDDSLVSVNKMFEKFIYADIAHSILQYKLNVQEYVVRRIRKSRSSLLANARIRMSNLHPSRLLMPMRGKDKWLK